MQQYLDLLTKFLSFKSISTDPKYKDECVACANWLKEMFEQNGFKSKLITGTLTNPVVFAEYVRDASAKTILIYGHYDVQPATKADGWSTDDPFTLAKTDTKLIARGVIDNKGQVLVHIASIFDLIKQNKLKYNIKFLIEGNEETGNTEIFNQVKQNINDLACDLLMISDGERPAITNELPVLEVSLRGGGNATLKLRTSHTNLHSGLYGKAIPTALEEMYLLLAKLYKDDQTINIEGYYDELPAPTEAQLRNNEVLVAGKDEEILSAAGVSEYKKESGVDFYTQTGLRPSIIVTGIKGGYINDGYANIVPCECEAKINFRTVEPMDPVRCMNLFKDFVGKNLPKYVKWEILPNKPYRGYFADTNAPDFKEAEEVLKKIFKADRVVHRFVGGGIPIVTCFKEVLGKDTILLPLVNHDCNMHGIDENFDIELLKQSLDFSREYFGVEN